MKKARYLPRHALALALTVAPASHALAELNYQSALDGYQSYSEPEMANWPQAIKTVEEIGGWRAYARETSEPSPAAPPTRPVAAEKPAEPTP